MSYHLCALSVHDNRQCDDPRLHTRIRTWDVQCSLHDDDRAYHGQPIRVQALQLVHESVRNYEHALPIHFESLQGPIRPITGQAADKLLPFTCALAQSKNEV